jgi:hypothetical protein
MCRRRALPADTHLPPTGLRDHDLHRVFVHSRSPPLAGPKRSHPRPPLMLVLMLMQTRRQTSEPHPATPIWSVEGPRRVNRASTHRRWRRLGADSPGDGISSGWFALGSSCDRADLPLHNHGFEPTKAHAGSPGLPPQSVRGKERFPRNNPAFYSFWSPPRSCECERGRRVAAPALRRVRRAPAADECALGRQSTANRAGARAARRLRSSASDVRCSAPFARESHA